MGAGLDDRPLLMDIGAADPSTYAVALAVIVGCGIAATYLPALRAMSIDPMDVLKRDCRCLHCCGGLRSAACFRRSAVRSCR